MRLDLTSKAVCRPQWPQNIIFFVEFLKSSPTILKNFSKNTHKSPKNQILHFRRNCIKSKPCYSMSYFRQCFYTFLASWRDLLFTLRTNPGPESFKKWVDGNKEKERKEEGERCHLRSPSTLNALCLQSDPMVGGRIGGRRGIVSRTADRSPGIQKG